MSLIPPLELQAPSVLESDLLILGTLAQEDPPTQDLPTDLADAVTARPESERVAGPPRADRRGRLVRRPRSPAPGARQGR